MGFLRRLFGGGGSPDRALYLYVRPKMCKEVLRVRVDLLSGPSRTEDGRGFYMRKIVSGSRCPFQVELELYFDGDKRLTDQQITNGELVTEADYNALYGQAEDA